MLRFSPSPILNLPEEALQRGIREHGDPVFPLCLAATDDVHLLAMVRVGGGGGWAEGGCSADACLCPEQVTLRL